jgi:homoserine dehydrogenase
VISDIIEIARRRRQGNISNPYPFVQDDLQLQPIGELETEYYIRLKVLDQPGVLAEVAGCLGESGISISSFIQHEQQSCRPVPVVLTTHVAQEARVQQALKAIERLPANCDPPFVMRIERLDSSQ